MNSHTMYACLAVKYHDSIAPTLSGNPYSQNAFITNLLKLYFRRSEI